jgi:HK97 family phage prohead protease
MNATMERRVSSATVRAEGGSKSPTLVGYAAKFNSLSGDLGGFRERIASGAFDRAMKERHDVRFLVNHDPNIILGRTKSGTLRLSQDDKGLRFECQLPDTQAARDVWASVQRGDMDGCSFAFSKPVDAWDTDTDENGRQFARRTLRSFDLHDCSVVAYPAYDHGTSVDARGLTIVHAQIPTELRSPTDSALARATERLMKKIDERDEVGRRQRIISLF